MNNVYRTTHWPMRFLSGALAFAILLTTWPGSVAIGMGHQPFGLGSQSKTIPEVIGETNNLSTLFDAVSAAGLAELLGTSDPITVFAPTNAAFNNLPEGTVESLLLPENKDALINILSYHVVAGKYRFSDVIKATLFGPVQLTTLSGDSITVYRNRGMIMIQTPNNTARVVRPDLYARNGVIHIINAVLLP